jgi:urea transporter
MTAAMDVRLHLKEYFEGIGQALFFKDARFGIGLLAISLFFQSHLFIYGILASLIGYAYTVRYRTPKALKFMGLMTINSFFFGIALASLFQPSPAFYICLLTGSLALPLVTKAVFEVLQHWKLNPLIAPYILTIWVFYLCADSIALHPVLGGDIKTDSILLGLLPFDEAWRQILSSIFFSMSQIFFFHNSDYGLCLLLLISLFSPRRGLHFLVCTTLASLLFYQISAGYLPVAQQGVFSFSAGLVGLGLASMPEKFSLQTILFFSALSLFLTLASEHLLRGFGLPLLSLPYVITFWFALLSRVPRLNVSWAPAEII